MSTKHIPRVHCEDLPVRAEEYKAGGYRLLHLSCAKAGDSCTMHYIFGRDSDVEELEVMVSGEDLVPSITRQYSYAVAFESEIHERHGIFFHGTSVDFKGLLYRTSVSKPYACRPWGEKDRQD